MLCFYWNLKLCDSFITCIVEKLGQVWFDANDCSFVSNNKNDDKMTKTELCEVKQLFANIALIKHQPNQQQYSAVSALKKRAHFDCRLDIPANLNCMFGWTILADLSSNLGNFFFFFWLHWLIISEAYEKINLL